MILQVVDFPLVPVTIIDLKLELNKYNKSISVIIFFSYFFNKLLYFDLNKLTPGLKIMKSTFINAFLRLKKLFI